MPPNRARIASIVFMLTFSINAWGKVFFFVGGGGGEGDDKANQFESEFQEFAKFSVSYGEPYQHRILFDGEHPNQQKNVAALTPRFYGDFSKENLEKSLNVLKENIKKGVIKSGDTLMVIFSTHGSAKSDNEPHQIWLTEGKFDIVSEIKALQKELAGKNILLGVIDNTCYSGATHELSNDYTCVISVAGNQVGYTGFFDNPLQSFKPGATLENIYQEARSNFIFESSPQISTEVDKKVRSILSELYEYIINEDHDIIRRSDIAICPPETVIQNLRLNVANILQKSNEKSLIEKFRAYAQKKLSFAEEIPPEAVTEQDLESYKKILFDYHSKRTKLSSLAEIINGPEPKRSHKYETNEFVYTVNSSWLAEYKWPEVIKDMKSQYEAEKNPKTKNKKLEHLNSYIAAEKLHNKLIKEDQNYKDYVAAKPAYEKLLPELEPLAHAAKQLERTLYDKFYTALKKKDDNNPCTNIRF